MIVLDTWFEKVKIYFRKINEPVGGARNTIPSYPSVTASHRAAAQFEWQVAGDWILRLRHVFKTPTWIQQNRHLLAVCHFNFIMSAGTEFRDKISGGRGGGVAAYRYKQDPIRYPKSKQLSVHPFKIINMKDWGLRWDAACRPNRTENSTTPLQKPKSSQVERRFRWMPTNAVQPFNYRGADKSLARPGRKQANVSVRVAWISFSALPCRKNNLMIARVSMLLKLCAYLTCIRACFLPGRAMDLSAPRYVGQCFRH